MSVVTNVMLQFLGCAGDTYWDDDDAANVARVQEIVGRLAGGQQFKDIISQCDDRPSPGESWGGCKYPECDLLAGAFNYLPLDEFISELEKLTWREPGFFRLFVQGQEADAFGVWLMHGGKITCVVPETGL